MKRRITIAVALCAVMLAAAAGLSGCGGKDAAIKVNGQVITTDQINAQLDLVKKRYPTMFTGSNSAGALMDFKKRIADDLVNQALIEQAAQQKGIDISDDDIQKQVDQLRGNFKDQSQFDKALQSAGMTLDQLKTQIRSQLVTQKLVEVLAASTKVTDADIQQYYNNNKAEFTQPAAKRASHILFKDQATAEKVLKMLQTNKITFSQAAREYSIDPSSASKGGDLGWPTQSYVPEFEAAVKKLKKGQMSDVVQSPVGWHIILVTDERPATQQPLSDVKSQIEEMIVQQRRSDAYQQFLNNLHKNAKIEYIESDLKPLAAGGASTATTGTK
jgi:foldase protein PrsA